MKNKKQTGGSISDEMQTAINKLPKYTPASPEGSLSVLVEDIGGLLVNTIRGVLYGVMTISDVVELGEDLGSDYIQSVQ